MADRLGGADSAVATATRSDPVAADGRVDEADLGAPEPWTVRTATMTPMATMPELATASTALGRAVPARAECLPFMPPMTES
jgi:hypothetical protein